MPDPVAASLNSIGWIVCGSCDSRDGAFPADRRLFPPPVCGKHFARCAHTAIPSREILMATGLENEQKELAHFIRQGSSRGPQCFGSYFDEKGGSCALGAVYEGVYHLPRESRQADPGSSRAAVPVPGRGDEAVPAGLQQAAAARVDDRAPERRPPADARADRRMADAGIERLNESTDSA